MNKQYEIYAAKIVIEKFEAKVKEVIRRVNAKEDASDLLFTTEETTALGNAQFILAVYDEVDSLENFSDSEKENLAQHFLQQHHLNESNVRRAIQKYVKIRRERKAREQAFRSRGMEVCDRCGGSGQYLHYGVCFKCNGVGGVKCS